MSLMTVFVLFLVAGYAAADEPVEPATVTAEFYPGESMVIDKAVTTPPIPPVVDVCLLEDETGSFGDDIAHLQGGTTASDIYDSIVAASPSAWFAVAGFRDYPQLPHGGPGDWVYRTLSAMNASKAAWLTGIGLLTASGGADGPEAQYDAIVAAAADIDGCGWRDPAVAPGVQRVLIVATDASFHLPGAGKPHVNTQATTIAALQAQSIIVVGLKAPGAGGELDALAAATGGSVQPLSSDGANIAQAILDGLEEVMTDVWWEIDCPAGLNVSLAPEVHYDIPGDTTVHFEESISVPNETPPGDYSCTVTFVANNYPDEGAEIGSQKIDIRVIPIPVPVDIKPQSCPNPLNTKKKGVLPVAIAGTEILGATQFDPETIRLEGVAPLRWSFEDVTTPFQPFTGKQDCYEDCSTAGSDGFGDLTLKFDAQEVIATLGDVSDRDCLVLTITGNLMDARAIVGEDVVVILSK
jgi:hypothetical protein